ncbi:MAG: extracellular solute-binding protein [Treponema sp.]|jgi:raffinose/stachyose/melibiose transport system substrate-binding protein|nr:extracellular solute-binding protein [Treponema sp.]
MKKRIVLAAVTAAALLGLAGCSGAKSGGDSAKLVYWSMWNEAEPQGQVIARAAEAFTKETGIAVDINFNGRDIRKTLQPALDAGEAIDLFDEDIERVANTWGNYLLPLDEYVSKAYSTTGGRPYGDVINKTLLNLARELGSGQVKNIPYQPMAFVTMYNKDLFEKAGIASLPKTGDELLEACAKLAAIGVTGLTVDDAYMAAFFGYNMDRLVGADATYAMVQNNDFTGPQVLQFGQMMEMMVQNGYFSQKAASNIYPAGQVEEIATGRVAMYLNGTWLPNEIKGNAPNMRWGSFAWPALAPTGDGIETNNFGSQSFGINKNTKYPEEAFQFIVWLTTGEWDATLAQESIGIPMGNDSAWPEALAEAKVVVDSTTRRLRWGGGMEDNPDINAKIKENLAKLIMGSFNSNEFAAAMAR